jgi:hypothetical protein
MKSNNLCIIPKNGMQHATSFETAFAKLSIYMRGSDDTLQHVSSCGQRPSYIFFISAPCTFTGA